MFARTLANVQTFLQSHEESIHLIWKQMMLFYLLTLEENAAWEYLRTCAILIRLIV